MTGRVQRGVLALHVEVELVGVPQGAATHSVVTGIEAFHEVRTEA